jgi:2-polyprenyl-6-methoxyphenol hydroxylase-like FAD-dependent oxidoreductase
VGAYVLAGELAGAGEDHRAALARYEARMRPYATRCQKGAARAGAFFAPPSRFSLAMRNLSLRVLTSRRFSRLFERIVTGASSDFSLPNYAV